MRTTAEQDASRNRQERNELKMRQDEILHRIESGACEISQADFSILPPRNRIEISRSDIKIK